MTDEEIARIVARWTGIPVEKLVEGEREKLLHLDDVLHKRVIGQDEAVTKVSEAILRSRAGIANPESIFELEVVYTDLLWMDVYIDEELYYQSYPIEPNSEPGDIAWKDMNAM